MQPIVRSIWPLHLTSRNGAHTCRLLVQSGVLLKTNMVMPTDLISEENHMERRSRVRFKKATPVAELSELKRRLYAWPQTEISVPH